MISNLILSNGFAIYKRTEEDIHSTRPQGADHEIIKLLSSRAVQSIFQDHRDKKLLLLKFTGWTIQNP